MLKKILSVTICIFAISISVFIVMIPLVNNHYAKQLERELRETPLLEKTEIIDSVSRTRKINW